MYKINERRVDVARKLTGQVNSKYFSGFGKSGKTGNYDAWTDFDKTLEALGLAQRTIEKIWSENLEPNQDADKMDGLIRQVSASTLHYIIMPMIEPTFTAEQRQVAADLHTDFTQAMNEQAYQDHIEQGLDPSTYVWQNPTDHEFVLDSSGQYCKQLNAPVQQRIDQVINNAHQAKEVYHMTDDEHAEYLNTINSHIKLYGIDSLETVDNIEGVKLYRTQLTMDTEARAFMRSMSVSDYLASKNVISNESLEGAMRFAMQNLNVDTVNKDEFTQMQLDDAFQSEAMQALTQGG